MIKISQLSSNFPSKLLFCHYKYVRQKVIDEICEGYGDGWKDKIKMYTKMFAHIGKEGFIGAKNDYYLYQSIKNIPATQRTSEDWNNLIRMRHDAYRLLPLWIIQILPMSGPLFMLYMYTYPGSIPSWFIIDKFHEQYQKSIRISQKQAVEYFKNSGLKGEEIDWSKLSLEESRKLAICLYGYYRDGTIGYRKLFKKPIQYLISQSFSKYLIMRKLKYKFKSDLEHVDILKSLTFDEKIKWKYHHVIVEGNLIKPYEDSISPEELKARQQYQQHKVNNVCNQK